MNCMECGDPTRYARAVGDDARRRILERRAAFVAAALSTVAADGCSKPRVCLDVPNEIVADDAVAKPPPPAAPTYEDSSTVKAEEDAGTDASTDTGAPKPFSAPCLSVAHPRDAGAPKPCLKVDPYD
jgi:hypothetical protein